MADVVAAAHDPGSPAAATTRLAVQARNAGAAPCCRLDEALEQLHVDEVAGGAIARIGG